MQFLRKNLFFFNRVLVAMIGAIVLARRDVLDKDIGTGDSVNQGLIEKASSPILIDNSTE